MDWTLEVVILPVSDIDRSIKFVVARPSALRLRDEPISHHVCVQFHPRQAEVDVA